MKELSEDAKVILAALVAMNELIDKGFVDGEKFEISIEGEMAIEGYEPDPVKFQQVLSSLFIKDGSKVILSPQLTNPEGLH